MAQPGKKRELVQDDPRGGTPTGTKKKLKTSKHVARPVKKEKKKQHGKGFLDLPAELRNRIYHFACEDDFGDYDNTDPTNMFTNPAPLIIKHGPMGKSQWPMTKSVCEKSGRKFFGLTQVCRKIREEYKPIWLSNSSVRIRAEWPLSVYLHQFYGSCHPREHLPKLIQITLDHEWVPILDITHLLRLRAAHPETKIAFIPDALTDLDEYRDFYEECPWCIEEMTAEEIAEGLLPVGELPDYKCPHSDELRRAFCTSFLENELPCLEAMNNLLAHDDPNWLEDLQSRGVTCVRLEYHSDLDPYPDVTIRLAHHADIVKSKNKNKSIKEVVTSYVKSRNLKATDTSCDSHLHFQLLIPGSCME